MLHKGTIKWLRSGLQGNSAYEHIEILGDGNCLYRSILCA